MNDNTINGGVTLGGSEGTLLANRYRVIRQLGQGGMGSVWLAADTQLDNREVAIKMLPSILVSNKRAYIQLKSEALVSLKLTHPNIATVRAFEENNGNPFLVVDYIDGQTLDDYLADKGKLSEDETIGLLGPIASALDYAHGEGVVHRDVKPGNVMIRKDGHPFILDFGIAREIQETLTRVTGKLSSGTLMYMSPEQLHGAVPSSAHDVYSFAAMAYECLTGTPPFSRGQIEYQIEHDSPAPIDPQVATCGSGIMAGLAKKPEDRPANCAAVLSGGGHEVTAPVGHGDNCVDEDGRARAPREPRRWQSMMAALLVIAAVCGAGYVWHQGQQDALSKQAEIARLAEAKKALEAEKAETAAKRELEERAAAEEARKEKEKIEAEIARLAEAKKALEAEKAEAAAKREREERAAAAEARKEKEKIEVEIARLAEEKKTLEAEKAEAAAKREREERAAAEAARKEKERIDAEKARVAEEKARAVMDQKNRREAFSELARVKTQISIKCDLAKAAMKKIEPYRDEELGFKSHFETIDAQWKCVESLPKYDDLPSAKKVLATVAEASDTIAYELRWIETNKKGRDDAVAIEKSIVKNLEPLLKRYDVPNMATALYDAGVQLRKDSKALLESGQFADAGEKFTQAKSKLEDAIAEARSYHVCTALASAKEFQKAGLFEKALKEAERAASFDPKNLEVSKLKADIQVKIDELARVAREKKEAEERKQREAEQAARRQSFEIPTINKERVLVDERSLNEGKLNNGNMAFVSLKSDTKFSGQMTTQLLSSSADSGMSIDLTILRKSGDGVCEPIDVTIVKKSIYDVNRMRRGNYRVKIKGQTVDCNTYFIGFEYLGKRYTVSAQAEEKRCQYIKVVLK